jgi:hypothetical protein
LPARNAGPKSELLYLAAYPDVIAVTATGADDKLYSGANRGSHIAVARPGARPLPVGAGKRLPGSRPLPRLAAAEVSGLLPCC